MEILPVEAIRDDLEAMALLRMELFDMHAAVDRQLMELNLSMQRNMGETGQEYDLSRRLGQAVSMLSTAQEKIRKDGMIGQLELKSGVVEPLEKEQYHEKENLRAAEDAEREDADSEEAAKALEEAKEHQKEQSILFISNQMGARMRQISLAEEDFYYYVKEILKMLREREACIHAGKEEDTKAGIEENLNQIDELAEKVEQVSTMTEAYLAGYLKVTNTIKDVVLRNQLLIVIHK